MKNRLHASLLFFNKYPKGILFLSAFLFYFYFSGALLYKGNSTLSSASGDALKNYYTYMHHSVNDTSFWHFGGMAYPYGEHVVFTDAIPLLSGVLQQIPVLHPYLIGLLHALIFLSFVYCPLILYDVFKMLGAHVSTGFWLALGIALLNPQWIKIQHGHFALAFGCLIVYNLKAVSKWYVTPKWNLCLINTAFSCIVFFIHPYMGFGATLLALCFTFCKAIQSYNTQTLVQGIIFSMCPVALFKILLFFTDTHAHRPELPYGNTVLVENLRSLIDPEFGIFKNWARFLSERPAHYEGHTYLGFGLIIWMLITISACIVYKIKTLNPLVWPLGLATVVFLILSFGYHLQILDGFNSTAGPLLQFRANCRFAWFVYITLPLLVFGFSNTLFKQHKIQFIKRLLPFCFFCICAIEASSYFRMNAAAFWKFPNLFKTSNLNSDIQGAIKTISKTPHQALLPLPVYAIGSERFDRLGSEASLYASVVLGFHCNLPILSSWLSRSSLSETAAWLELLNAYDAHHKSYDLLNPKPILCVNTPDLKLPQEERLALLKPAFWATKQFSLSALLPGDLKLKNNALTRHNAHDSLNTIYVPSGNSAPFVKSVLHGHMPFLKIPANTLQTGFYILSLHWKSSDSSYKSLAANVLITQSQNAIFKWAYYLPVNCLSGFYNDHYVFEHEIYITSEAQYECIIEGHGEVPFSIEQVVLRPKNSCVRLQTAKGTLLNGYFENLQ